jgi:hypothetical protein
MKQNLGEKNIERLFHELRREDEQRAPSFDIVLRAESSKAGKASPAWFSSRIAVAAAMFILVGGLVLISVMQSSLPPTEIDTPVLSHQTIKPPYQLEPLPYRQPVPSIEQAPILEARRGEVARPVRHKRPAARPHQRAMLISEWQSPTSLLLRTPGEQLLKTVPRVGESLIEIKRPVPDEKN